MSIRGDNGVSEAIAWRACIHTVVTIEDENGLREYNATHEISRGTAGRWRVSVQRHGREPTEMSGDGTMPAVIEAEGVVVIMIPRGD